MKETEKYMKVTLVYSKKKKKNYGTNWPIYAYFRPNNGVSEERNCHDTE